MFTLWEFLKSGYQHFYILISGALTYVVLLQNQLDESSRLHWEGKNINIMWGGGKLSFCAFFFVRMTLLKARPGESWGDSGSAASRNPPPHPSHQSCKLWAAVFVTLSVEILWLRFSNFWQPPLSILYSPFWAAFIQSRTWNSLKILNTIQMIRFRKAVLNNIFSWNSGKFYHINFRIHQPNKR